MEAPTKPPEIKGPSRRGLFGAAAGIAASSAVSVAVRPAVAAPQDGDIAMRLTINGESRPLTADVRTSLLDALREHLVPDRFEEGV